MLLFFSCCFLHRIVQHDRKSIFFSYVYFHVQNQIFARDSRAHVSDRHGWMFLPFLSVQSRKTSKSKISSKYLIPFPPPPNNNTLKSVALAVALSVYNGVLVRDDFAFSQSWIYWIINRNELQSRNGLSWHDLQCNFWCNTSLLNCSKSSASLQALCTIQRKVCKVQNKCRIEFIMKSMNVCRRGNSL